MKLAENNGNRKNKEQFLQMVLKFNRSFRLLKSSHFPDKLFSDTFEISLMGETVANRK